MRLAELTKAAIDDVMRRHAKIALQFSGGKDSLACLYLLRPHWDRLTVYFLNSGDAFPETLALIERVRALVPRFVEVSGRVAEVTAACGMPTDALPYTATPSATRLEQGRTPMIDRFSCCWMSVMQPLHERMLADGITLIIRGQKTADHYKSPARSGFSDGQVELLFPIEHWSDDEVFNFLAAEGVELPRFYSEGLHSTPDCMTCSAWWDERRGAYLQRHHPEAARVYRTRLLAIQSELKRSILPLLDELEEE